MLPTQSSGLAVSTTLRQAFGVAVVALAVGAVGPAESRAADGSGKMPWAGIGCGHYRLSSIPESALEAGIGRPSSVSLDGKATEDIRVWKTIAIGTYASIDSLLDALNAGCRVGNLAVEILERPAFTMSTTRRRIALVVISGAELGFDGEKGVSRAAVYKRAMQLGLKLCPAEVAPQLRLQYPDQPPGEFLHVAMDPIATHRAAAAFVVGNGGTGLLLIGSDAPPEGIVPATMRFVFVRSR